MNYKTIRITSHHGLPDNDAYCIHYPDGSKEYFYQKRLHRIDGPAVIFKTKESDEKVYYVNGKYYGTSLQNYTDEKFKQDLAKK